MSPICLLADKAVGGRSIKTKPKKAEVAAKPKVQRSDNDQKKQDLKRKERDAKKKEIKLRQMEIQKKRDQLEKQRKGKLLEKNEVKKKSALKHDHDDFDD